MWSIDYTLEYEGDFYAKLIKQAEDLIDKYPEILEGKDA
jgi:hypothetical protein